jgi:hypothetical protein
MIKVTYIDHAYAAGFLEADGCIQLTGVRVTNRCLDVLNWFEETYGGQIRSKVKPEGCWEWNLHADEAEEFVNLVYPHLKFKAPQADLFKEYRKTIQPRGKTLSKEIILERGILHAALKEEKNKWKLL